MSLPTKNRINMSSRDEAQASDRWLAFDAKRQVYVHMNGVDTTKNVTWAWHGYRRQFDQLKYGLQHADRYRLVKKADQISPVSGDQFEDAAA